MTGRDRMVLMVLAVAAVLVGGWMLVVAPERNKASQQEAQVASARAGLESARQQVANARTAEARYESAYASVVNLGKAVPPQQEVPSLVYELDQASNQRNVGFSSIASGSSSSPSPAPPRAGGVGAGSAVTPAAFTQMPFTFVFQGSFFGLAHLLGQIDGFARSAGAGSAATVADTGGVSVSGRLLTVQGVNIALDQSGGPSGGSGVTSEGLTATITATAYVLPASQGLTNGATPAGPAGSGAAAGSSGSSGSPTSPAVIVGAP